MSADAPSGGAQRARERSVAELVALGTETLAPCTPTPRLDAEVLLAACSGSSRAALLAFPERAVDAERAALFRAHVARRATGEPVAYIVGEKEFYSLTLRVAPAVLVPRPETELLVDVALRYLDEERLESVLDLGTGSGAIALAIKHECPAARVTALDRDPAALAVARDNAERLGIDTRFVESDWFAALAEERFDVIVSNPPYVPSADPHFAGALRFEPRRSLDGGPDGLAAVRAILAAAPRHLSPRGLLVLEHGYDQRAAVLEHALQAGFTPAAVHADLAGIARVAALRAPRR